MYCKYCGKQIDDDSVYCRYCGKKVGEDIEVAETKPTTEEELDYEVIDEKTYHSDFHIRFKDGNCLYFSRIDDKRVSVVAPDWVYDFTGKESPGWNNHSTPKGHLNIPNFVKNKKKYSVTEIWYRAFCGCSGLQSIVIPDSVTEIGNYAFSCCSSLQSVVIPESVTEIERDAFYDCSGLQRIVVDKNNPNYDSRNDCNAIIETSSNMLVVGCMNTIIPDSVTEIEYGAFEGCSGLQRIVIPDSVTEIGSSAFHGCSGLQSIVIPDSVTEIKIDAFRGCNGLQSIVIPDSVTEIGRDAFYGCSGLQSLVIPDSVTEIGDDAFYGCSSLQSIVIPDSVTEIGWCAFDDCDSLESIYVSKNKLEFFKKIIGYEDKIKVWEGENAKTDLKNTVRKTSNVSPYYLFFDTETTGIPMNYNAPTSDSSNWPRLVQLSWIVTDKDCRVLHQHDHIIYPDGFSIPNDAARIHGITTKIAQAKGVPLQKAIEEFLADFNKVEIIVGHNIAFDKKIVGAELIRLGKKDVMQTKTSLCTMESSTDFCKIYARNGGYKWPKLQELHKKLFGCEFEDAHNSMLDVTATLDCFRELKKRGIM